MAKFMQLSCGTAAPNTADAVVRWQAQNAPPAAVIATVAGCQAFAAL